jgi:hypothetical protein
MLPFSDAADIDHQDENAAWRFASLHGSSISANIEAKHPLSVQQYYPSHQEIVTAVQQEYSKQQQPLRPLPKLQQGVYQLTNEAEYTYVKEAYFK